MIENLGYSALDFLVLIALGMGYLVFVNGLFLNALYTLQLFVAYRALRQRRVASSPQERVTLHRDAREQSAKSQQDAGNARDGSSERSRARLREQLEVEEPHKKMPSEDHERAVGGANRHDEIASRMRRATGV